MSPRRRLRHGALVALSASLVIACSSTPPRASASATVAAPTAASSPRGVPQRPTPNQPAAAQPNGSQSAEPGTHPAPPTSQREEPTSGTIAGPRSPTTPRAIAVMLAAPPDPSGPSRVEALPANVDEHTDTFDVELTLGCGSIVAEGSANVSDVAMEIDGPGLDRVTHDDARGRTETFELCPLRMGRFTVRVRMQSLTSAGATQARLFLVHNDGRRVEVVRKR